MKNFEYSQESIYTHNKKKEGVLQTILWYPFLE